MKSRHARPGTNAITQIPSRELEKIRSPAPRKPENHKIKLKHVLVPVDFSGPSKHALQFSAHFAREFGAALTLLFVSQPLGFPYSAAQTEEEAIQNAETYMTSFQAEVGLDADLIESKIVRSGKPSYEICTVADMLKSDLIIISSYGNGRMENILIGSTADGVVRHAHCPVLVFHQRICAPYDQDKQALETQASKRRFKIQNILVPIDFSTCSLKALDYALPLARKFKAKVFLIHSVPVYPEFREGSQFGAETFQSRVRESAAMNLEVLRRSISPKISVESVICQGVPYVEINWTAHEVKADLVVLTTHGHTGLAYVHLGSTAEKVVRHACCPVLVIRESEHEFIE